MTTQPAGPAAYLNAAAFAAPGMPDWPTARAILRGEQPYVYGELPAHQTALLPANERRRASAAVRLAFRIAEAAVASIGESASTLATVFASADGDLGIACRICQALAEPQRQVSPTDFHNSVHNAPAGYWSIATQATGSSTAISAGDSSFAAGLLEALCMVTTENRTILLIASDVPAPPPLQDKHPMRHIAGTGLILSPTRSAASLARLTAELTGDPDTCLPEAPLEALRLDNPAARSLPLLELLACGRDGAVCLPLGSGLALRLQVRGTSGLRE